MSIHTDRAYAKACRNGAGAATTYATWNALMAMPKRELAEIAMHLAAICTDSYDSAIADGTALARVNEERTALRFNGLI